MKETITMSTQEVERVSVLDRLMKKEIKQRHASQMLHISTRQVRTLVKRYKREGAKGIIHKLRGVIGNRKIDELRINQAIQTIKINYADFGPTLAHEKLIANHGITFSRETLRRAMINDGMWKEKQRKIVTLHQLRERRGSLGELVQADGSPHDWFEGRAPKCTLLVFIDDATGKLLHLELVVSESTASYFLALEHYLTKHGRPLVLYIDKHGVFRVNTTKSGTAAAEDSNGLTQFGRAMHELAIEIIYANSAEAKGRVERVNQTLQDRLVKEMRLKGISTLDAANAYFPEFIEQFNRRFAVVAQNPVNMHRPLLAHHTLNDILCLKYTRILSRQLTVSYENRVYQIQTERPLYAMRLAPVTITEDMVGKISILYKGKTLAYTIFNRQPKQSIVDAKQLNLVVDEIIQNTSNDRMMTKIPWVPPQDHPWRRYSI